MAEAGDGDRDAAADANANAGPALLSAERVETYYGENQDLEQLTAHVAPQVEQLVQDLAPEDLLPCLRQGVWDRAFEILDEMVTNGQAVAGAIETEGIDPLDIRRAHPELVILLRGQAYWDLKGREGDARANAYLITLTCFIPMVKAPIYFPEFRHEVEEGSIRVGLFGERKGRTVRCLACHKEFEGYTPGKLRSHLMHDAKGKQARCQASTIYIREEIQAAEEEAAAAALHPPPPAEEAAADPHAAPDGQGDAPDDGGHPLPPPDAVTENSAAPNTTSTAAADLRDINVDAPAAAEDDHSTEVAPAASPRHDDE
ncbi:hypothetical protein EJB05_54166, partial [Eragrostis curvula]